MPKKSWSKQKYFREIIINKSNPEQLGDGVSKLGDVMTKLPNGIVFKDETGMGATTLELRSKRNSIIVEPIKITASSKAHKYNGKVLYVGSPTENYHPNKIEDKDILKYLQDSEIKFKKIIVVADSLNRVINAILDLSAINKLDAAEKEIQNLADLFGVKRDEILENTENGTTKEKIKKNRDYKILSNYFLFIDEIDSFQLDSSYRRSMEDCLDYYKMFMKTHRCMLSATDIRFTDPELQNETLTIIKYNLKTQRTIDIITSGTKQLLGKTIDRIIEKQQLHPNDKILVAFNSVSGCFNLAENLSRLGIFKKEQIGILCSIQSKDKVGGYFQELDSDSLPKSINFITSAYFTGFDLHEQFHLISISGNRSISQALSERRLKQIAGRCRVGLLSETVIHDIAIDGKFRNAKIKSTSLNEVFGDNSASNNLSVKNKKKVLQKEPTQDELINAATEQVRSLECMNKHYRSNKMLHEILEDLNDRFLRLLDEKQMRFVRKDKDKKIKISYLNIDAKLESIRVRKELYMVDDALTKRLQSEGHKINVINRLKVSEIIDSKAGQHGKDDKVRVIINRLKNIDKVEDLDEILKNEEYDKIQKSIVWDFKKIYEYLDHSDILTKMEKTLIGSRDNRKYNALLISAQIQTLPDGHIMIDRIKYYFNVGERFTPQEVFNRMKILFLETGHTKTIKNEREAVKMLRNFRKIYRKTDQTDGVSYWYIRKENPEKIIVTAKRPRLETLKII